VIDSAAQTLSSREQVRSGVKIEEHEELRNTRSMIMRRSARWDMS